MSEDCCVLGVIVLTCSAVGVGDMIMLGPSWHSVLVISLVSHNGETSHSGWIETGEWWIC